MDPKIRRNIEFRILGEEKTRRIHEASLHLIERTGMRIEGDRALELLRSRGATLGADGLCRLPRELVQWALETCPKELVLYARDGTPSLVLDGENRPYFGCHADMLELVDFTTEQVRPFLRADIRQMCRLADALPNIHFVLSVGLAQDVRPEAQSQVAFLETVLNFSKTINFSTNDVEALRDIIGLAATVAGGPEQLRERPFIFYYCEPIPPLFHPRESTEKLIVSAESGVPVVYMPYCMMGGTAPLSFAGALAQCHAEVLVGLTLTQLVQPGAPFIYGAMPSLMDMKTTIGSYGAVEFHLLVAAAAELAHAFRLPFYGTAGCTDAKNLDEQAVAESTMQILSSWLSPANLIHDVGVSDHCRSVNPLLVVLCDELIEMLGRYTQGVEVNEETLALEVIEKVGPGRAYLNEVQTMKNFRQIYYSGLFSRKMQNPEQSEVRAKLKDRLHRILEQHEVRPLDEGIQSELRRRLASFEE